MSHNNFYMVTLVKIVKYDDEDEDDEISVTNRTFENEESMVEWMIKTGSSPGTDSFYDEDYKRTIVIHTDCSFMDNFDESYFKFKLKKDLI